MDKVAKAVTAALVAGYGVYEVASTAGVSTDEWVRVAVFTAVAGLAVWAVPNAARQRGVRVMSADLKTLIGIEEAAMVRPGDTLVLRVPGFLFQDEFRRLVDRVGELMPGVKLLVVNADGMAIYRPDDGTACICPVVDVTPAGADQPEYVLGEPAVGCPVHGGAHAAAMRRAREAS